MSYSVWQTHNLEYSIIQNLTNQLSISDMLATILFNRGIRSVPAAQKFLYGAWDDLQSPWELNGVRAAVNRIELAISRGEKIIIYGDYDADGICSAVLLKEALQARGTDPEIYIPDRFKEGYGVNQAAVEMLARDYDLMITVDCGITSVDEISKAKDLGMDSIVTDHHQPGKILPPALAIINPKIDNHLDSWGLAGVGVAFKLAEALCSHRLEPDFLYGQLDLVALATIADIVPLTGDNRILVKEGLKYLGKTSRPGLKALLKAVGLEGKPLDSWQVAFMLAPRINAAGRVGSAMSSVELLATEDEEIARQKAALLCDYNDQRRAIEGEIYEAAIEQIPAQPDLNDYPVLIVDGENWHHGVIGIVASRMVEKYHRPVIIVSWEGDRGRGSGRSIEGLDLYQGLSGCAEELEAFGGHQLAAGLTVTRSRFKSFCRRMMAWARDKIATTPGKVYQIDYEIDASMINDQLLEELKLLQPFGEGNPVPQLVLRSASIETVSLVGKNKEHFRARIFPGLDLIAFNQPGWIDLPVRECCQDILFQLEQDQFRGRKRLQLKAKSMKSSYFNDYGKNNPGVNKFYQLINRSIEYLRKGTRVVYVYPTSRLLNKHRTTLEQFFQPRVLRFLYGKIPCPVRSQVLGDLKKGQPGIYLTTTAYLHYLRSKGYELSEDIFMVDMWNKGGKLTPNSEVWWGCNPIEGCPPWSKWDGEVPSRSLVYANRSSTILKARQQLSGIAIEAGLNDVYRRREARRMFMTARTNHLLIDGSYLQLPGTYGEVSLLFFADVPFSIGEAIMISGPVEFRNEQSFLFLGDKNDLMDNRSYLEKAYPNASTLTSLLRVLVDINRPGLSINIHELSQLWGEKRGEETGSWECWAGLQILYDLDLCRFRKKGSMIEIKLPGIRKNTFNTGDSPYYQEGIAERQAWLNLEKKIVQDLEW
ncbi:single-stranded-DNA-specific exonuclease RecJ [Syntrophomonas erecta]